METASRLMQHNVLCAQTFSHTCSQRHFVYTRHPSWMYVLFVCVWHCPTWRQSHTLLYLDGPFIRQQTNRCPTKSYLPNTNIPKLTFIYCIATKPNANPSFISSYKPSSFMQHNEAKCTSYKCYTSRQTYLMTIEMLQPTWLLLT